MIVVRETAPGVFDPVAGNPTLTSLDGKVRAPLLTILHESWTADDRAKFGVHVVEPVTTPDGKRQVGHPTYEKRDNTVVQVVEVEDEPEPEPDRRSPTEKMEALAEACGLTLNEMRAVLLDGVKP